MSSNFNFSFIPRSLHVARKQTKSSSNKRQSSASEHFVVEAEGNDDDFVKETPKDQRWPNAEEPVCVICGRYGEYICDETDKDVCSLKCKQDNIASAKVFSSTNNQQPLLEKNSVKIKDFYIHFEESIRHVRQSLIAKSSNCLQSEQYREKLQIKVKGESVPKLTFGFNECGFIDKLLFNLKDNYYHTPTIVQMQALPAGLSHRDMLVASATSSGKTASFILPIIQIIAQFMSTLSPMHAFRRLPLALIMAPTRELCMQIEEQTKTLCDGIQNIKTCLLVGGNPLPKQLYRLRHRVQIIIGTPGRINDILDNHEQELDLQHVKMYVLDEVDVMLQMGFLNQINRILDSVQKSAQTMMFSATIPTSIKQIAEKRMRNPLFISVGQSGVTDGCVHQYLLWVEDNSKRKKLFSILNDSKHFRPPVLVFVESKLGADMLMESIKQKLHINCESIHSNKTQKDRSLIVQNFLAGSFDVLVSTNIMGRGLDLPNVKQVIIFDMPQTIEDYIHQVGRAGRLRTKSLVMAFINKSNKSIFIPLQELCRKSGTKLPDEVVNSSYFKDAFEKKRKKSKEKDAYLKRKKVDGDNLNQKSLLQILTKQSK